MKIAFKVNGRSVRLDVPPERRLLDILRLDLGLTGTREGCGDGSCGACLVLLDNLLVNACLVPAFRLPDAEVTTVEGLEGVKLFRELRASLEEAGAFRCGFCSSAVLLSATDLLARQPSPDAGEIRRALAGTICRCGSYRAIVEGIERVGRRPGRKTHARRS